MTEEYVSNPRLAILAEELRILNDELIQKNIPDSIRLIRLRQFAESAKNIVAPLSDAHLYDGVRLPRGVSVTKGDRYLAKAVVNGRQKYLGTFDTVTEASNAYQAAKEANAATSIDEEEESARDLPKGVSGRPSGRFVASIGSLGQQAYLGTFDTPEEAHEAYKAAHIKLHGKSSRYYTC